MGLCKMAALVSCFKGIKEIASFLRGIGNEVNGVSGETLDHQKKGQGCDIYHDFLPGAQGSNGAPRRCVFQQLDTKMVDGFTINVVGQDKGQGIPIHCVNL